MAIQSSKVEQHPKRKSIVDELLAGVPLRTIAERYSLSPMILSRYKRRVIAPALLHRQPADRLGVEPDTVKEMRQQRAEVMASVGQVTVRSRVEKLAERYDKWHDRVEKSKDPEQFSTLANSESKTLTLLADLTGERQAQQQSGPTFMMLLPQGVEIRQAETMDAGEIIDVAATSVEDDTDIP